MKNTIAFILLFVIGAVAMIAAAFGGYYYHGLKVESDALRASNTVDTIYIDSTVTVVQIDSTALSEANKRIARLKRIIRAKMIDAGVTDTVIMTEIDTLLESVDFPCSKIISFDSVHTIADWRFMLHGDVNCYNEKVQLMIGNTYNPRKLKKDNFGIGLGAGYMREKAFLALHFRYKSFNIFPLYDFKHFGAMTTYTYNFRLF